MNKCPQLGYVSGVSGPLFADDHHRRDYDALQEKLWRAKVRQNEVAREQRRKLRKLHDMMTRGYER